MIDNGYCTRGDLEAFTGAAYDPRNQLNADMAIEAASRQIDEMCHQFFYDTGAVSARTFRTTQFDRAYVDPFHTTVDTATGLIVETDVAQAGTYTTVWTATDYELERFNGMADAPYDTIYAVQSYAFVVANPDWGRRATLRVTARWGWATVPTAIKRACLVLASEMMQDPVTPFGVAGFDQFGAVRVRANPRVEQAVAPFVRWDRAGLA